MSNLSDIREKKTPININNETKYLYYDLNAFAELEEIYESADAAMAALSKGSIKAIINVLRAGLLHENESLTVKEVGKMFDISQIPEVCELINRAIEISIPEQKEKTESKNV